MSYRQLPIVVACLLLVVAGCGGDDPSPTPTEAAPGGNTLQPLTTGRDVLAPDGRYSLRVPADWVRIEDPLAELAFRSTEPYASLSMNVVREDLAEIQRPQAYAEAARRRIGSVYQNVISLSLAPVTVGTHDAYRWVYTARAGSSERLFYQLYVIDDGQGFVITGLAPPDADLSTTQTLFDSVAGTMTFARG